MADVVFGSRFLSGRPHRVLYFWHSLGNRLLTLLSNMFTDLNLTDMETCYKAFRREVLRQITIEENRFGIEPELTAKVAQGRLADLRGRHLLRRAHVRRGQEDRLARRRCGRCVCIVRYSPSGAACAGRPSAAACARAATPTDA